MFDSPDAAGNCRRCGRSLSRGSRTRKRPRTRPAALDMTPEPYALAIYLALYLILVLTTLLWLGHVVADPALTPNRQFLWVVGLELFHAILVLGFTSFYARLALPPEEAPVRVAAWVAGAAALGVLLGVNLIYTAGLRDYFQSRSAPPGVEVRLSVIILMLCVQPAVVEEVCFRYIGLGVLCRVTTTRAAVVATAAMFALAHLGTPVAMPYLFALGVVLGYARVLGGMALPVAMHFLHNLAVLAIQVYQ